MIFYIGVNYYLWNLYTVSVFFVFTSFHSVALHTAFYATNSCMFHSKWSFLTDGPRLLTVTGSGYLVDYPRYQRLKDHRSILTTKYTKYTKNRCSIQNSRNNEPYSCMIHNKIEFVTPLIGDWKKVISKYFRTKQYK